MCLKMKQKLSIVLTVLFVLFLLFFNIGNVVMAADTVKSAYNRIDRYSWCGLHIYSLAVRGYYTSDGSKIKSFDETYCLSSFGTLSMWSCKNESSKWIDKRTYTGICEASAYFYLYVGFETAIKLGVYLQDGWESVTAVAVY